jgi:hypothetical protein
MKSFITIFAGAAALTLFATGCHTGGAYEPRNTVKYNLEDQSQVVDMDARVQRSITYTGVQQRYNEQGRLEVAVNLRNRETRRLEVQVNCVFKDEQGFPTGDETPFESVILTENEQHGMKFVSMNDKARKFTVRIRQAH